MMEKMTHSFIILQYLGLWRPVYWLPGWKSRTYDAYTWFMVFLIATVVLSEFVELLRSMNDVKAFANNSFILLTMIGGCIKAANILIKRNGIIELTNMLEQNPCRAENKDELEIQHKFDTTIRFNTLSYATLVGSTVFLHALASAINDVPRRVLPYESWLPFDCQDSEIGYWLAYNHQVVTVWAVAAVHVAFDTLVSGLMLQTCAQLNILKYRFRAMPQILFSQARDLYFENKSNPLIPKLERKLLSQRVLHHTEIFKFAETTNDLFDAMISIQCAISTIVLCVSVLELSKMKLFTAEFTSIMMYLASMLFGIFIFCFCGYEVTTESMKVGDAVYEMDWSSLSTRTKTSLITIMVRTLKPIEVTSFHVMTLNLESFKQLVKFSYTTYNVLCHSQQ